jgi:hypothetical protein
MGNQLVKMQISITIKENSMEVSQKLKNGINL